MLHPFAPKETPFGRPAARPGQGRIPLTVVTGFLGAGKTTLIRALLRSEAGARSALIVNEFGEIGIDDALLRTSDERTVLLGNGCVCCAASSDLHRTLRELFADRTRGQVPDFDRVIVETSGVADPTPVLQALATDRALAAQFALAGLVTVVDAVNASASARQPEWRKQVALADRIIVTKGDLAEPFVLERLGSMLDELAPHALRATAVAGDIDPRYVLAPGAEEMGRVTFAADAHDHDHDHNDHSGHHHDHHHSERYQTFTLTREAPIDWAVMQQALDTLSALVGPSLLRLKGFVRVRGRPGPVVVHRVQHLSHAPEELSAWPGEERTRLVVIGQDLDQAKVTALVEAVWAFDPGEGATDG